MIKKFLLDACAVLSFLLDEKEAEKMQDIFTRSVNDENRLYMNLVNYGEICIVLNRYYSKNKAEEIQNLIKNTFKIEFLNLDLKLVEKAGAIKSNGGLAYPDAIALATSKIYNLTLLTKDQEFQKFTSDFDILFL